MATSLLTTIRLAAILGLAAASGCAAAQDLSLPELEAWLERYETAWETRDADRAAELFAADALYHEMPFDDPKRGRSGIREYWSTVTADQRDIDFRFEAVAAAGNTGVARWSATFRLESTGARIELDGVFVLAFDAAGSCTSLREWWHVREL
jgi:uncharacterized protein (TIGR02246 family)